MKVGVIGTGHMGTHHARVYASLVNHCTFIGVFDTDYTRASAVAESHGVIAFKSLQALLKQVDAVSIAVPTPEHYAIALQCLKENVHVLIEKPITETVPQAKKLIREAKKHNTLLQVGHIELFNPVIVALEKLIAQEKLISIELNRLRPSESRMAEVDVVSDSMIHDIYIAFQLIGHTTYEQLYTIGKQCEGYTKHAAALLKFPDEVMVQLTASFLTDEKLRTVRIITEDQLITADLLNRTAKKATLHAPNSAEDILIPEQEPLQLELLHFLEHIQHNKQPKVTGEDGLTALILVNKIIRKIAKR